MLRTNSTFDDFSFRLRKAALEGVLAKNPTTLQPFFQERDAALREEINANIQSFVAESGDQKTIARRITREQ